MAADEVKASVRPAWSRTDWKVAALFAGLPALLFAVAALAGYPLITGDDLVQNYPLEVLTGRIIAHGHMPLYDAWLWSGTPLLGGTNAHSLLPITLLFAFLPPFVAWIAGEVIVLAAAAIGCQLFLRRTGCSSLAAGLGGASFGLAGYFSSQIVHVDFVAAAAAIPWALVALHGLATRPADGRPRHALLLATAAAWLTLAGSPDIVIDAVVACGAYSLHLLLQPAIEGRRLASRLSLLGWTAAGGVTGVAIGSVQWLTAAAFLAASQRAHPSFAFISGGSLTGANFLELLVPHVLGGGSFGMRAFGGTFPLAEVDAYPGTLALVALFVMAAGFRRTEAWRWRVWLGVTVACVVIVAGRHTPFEHVIAALPIAGSERLPNRALILLALSAALLLGYFVDTFLERRLTRGETAAGLLPLGGIAAVVVATVVTSRPAGGALVAREGGWSVAAVAPYLILSTCLAVAAGWLLLACNRIPPRLARTALLALVVVDIACVDANQSSLAPTHSSALTPSLATAVRRLAGTGRYLVVDPELANGTALQAIGGPDIGVVAGLPDATGYGSLVWGKYASETGTHVQDGALASAFANGIFVSLGVRALLTLPSELLGPPGTGRWTVAPGTSTRWFGTAESVRSVTISLPNGYPSSPLALARLAGQIGLAGAGGSSLSAPTTAVPSPHGAVTIKFPVPATAVGVSFDNPSDADLELGIPVVTTSGGAHLSLSGALAAALQRGWVPAAPVGGFSSFVDANAAPPFRLTTPGATWRVISSTPWTGSTVVAVTTPGPATLVRSVAAVPGWRASIEHGGSAADVTVRRDGLVQQVAVPAGTSTITFWYDAPGWAVAQLVAGAGVLMFAGLVLLDVRARRQRRSGHPGAEAPKKGS